MKDQIGDVAIEEFVELKPKMYSFLIDNNEHEKAKGVNRNVIETANPNKYKNALPKNGYDGLALGYQSQL